MKFPSIRIEGSIFSSDILEKIEQSDIPGQLPKDFGFESNVKVKDEIAVAWADSNSYWKVFKGRVDNLKEGDSGTSETRKFWIIPFLGLLGYEIENYKSAQVISGKNYAISHFSSNLDNFPVHIMGVNDSLDKKRESGGPRMSPHSLLQEYINLTEHLYAILSNGFTLRLLRDSSRLVKLSYIEFDLEKMFEEDQFTDFAVLFRLLHSSRMPSNKETASESLIERYHLDALASGERIRSGLSLAVENSIKQFGTGFLNNPSNTELVKAIESNEANKELLHINLLRLIYRILFLMVIEERGLVYPEKADKNLKEIYYKYYSVSSIRKISELKYLSNGKFNNLWIQLKNTFLLFENEHSGKALGLKPLAGDLFGERAIELLRNCDLENKYLLECLNNLNFYSNDKGQKFRVNYAALSVEEFGSVYEGLLEFKQAINKSNGKYEYTFAHGDERSKSGSHYTPDELVQPLIKHSLDYIIEDRLKEKDKEKALLSITVLDISCGSGHILLNAARRIAIELAKTRTGEDQPNPSEYRKALKDVIKNCIYGVDKNPLAVELCKVALWLESHNPGEPLNFLDHKIKCGDSIVGLAHKEELEKGIPTEAFKSIPGDDKDIASDIRKKNKAEIEETKKEQLLIEFQKETFFEIEKISEELNKISNLPESTPEEVNIKKKKYLELNNQSDWKRLFDAANVQTAQFFIPKTNENKNFIATNEDFNDILYLKRNLAQKIGKALDLSASNKFFHWFLEFPEVFLNGGFNCVLSNPPFLGGQKLSGTYGDNYLEYIKYEFEPIGAVDLVTYFFRRIFTIVKEKGFQSLISTNTIAQGRAREDGLDIIVTNGGSINHAVRSMRWPGKAAVEVALVTITKQKWKGKFVLGGKEVKTITPYLDDSPTIGNPNPLKQNEGKSFQGSIVLGKGFILEPHDAEALIKGNSKYKDVLFPYLNGDDLNNNPDQNASRWVINFFDYPLNRYSIGEWMDLNDKVKNDTNDAIFNKETVIYAPHWFGGEVASDYPDCLSIVEELVKHERQLVSYSQNAKEKWWQYERRRNELYEATKNNSKVLCISQNTKPVAFVFSENNKVFDAKLIAFCSESFDKFAFIQSDIHVIWAWKYGTTLGAGTLVYTPTIVFQSFPFPQNLNSKIDNQLEFIGEDYHEHRKQLMLELQLGLTKTYNQFHNKQLSMFNDECSNDESINLNEVVKKYGKETVNLIKHFMKGIPNVSFDEAVKGIEKLRQLHVEMDNAVLEAYGWLDIELKHDFYEVDYLPENDRVRFTIHPDARREILKRLLELNHKIHDEEVKAGLWEKKKVKGKKKADVVSEPEAGLFEEEMEKEDFS